MKAFFTAEARRRGEKSGNSGIVRWVKTLWGIVHNSLREVFDENAYARFLERTHSSRSTASYRAFLRERESVVVNRPRCC